MQFDFVLSEIMLQYNVWFGEQFHLALDRMQSETEANEIQIDSAGWFDSELIVYDDQDQAILFKGRPLGWLGEHPQARQIVELAWHAAAMCDDDIPGPIVTLLKETPDACQALADFVLTEDFNRLQENFEDPRSLAISRLIRQAGACFDMRQVEKILDHFMASNNPDDLVVDALRQMVALHTPQSVSWLTERLQAALDQELTVTGPVEALMIFLSETGRNQHDPESFRALRTAFRRAGDKQMAALCLADYGDPRGIVVLRSWLDQHPEASRAERLEITAAIKRLGGETI